MTLLGTRRGLAVVLAVGVLGTGLVVAGLSLNGLDLLASIVWIVGYGATVAVLWYGWVRPLDLGPGGSDADPDGDGRDASDSGTDPDSH